jgi:hypothetical protein
MTLLLLPAALLGAIAAIAGVLLQRSLNAKPEEHQQDLPYTTTARSFHRKAAG